MRKILLIMSLFLFLLQPVRIIAADTDPITDPEPGKSTKEKHPCDQVPDGDSRKRCEECTGPADNITGFWTGIGCISTSPVQAVGELLGFMFGVGGFFVFIQIIVGAFGILVSRGNPKSVQDARDKIINSVVALLFIIFSITILELIGVKILSIPGFFDR